MIGSRCADRGAPASRDLSVLKPQFHQGHTFSRLDLISCRNAIIYLGQELQRKILSLFHYVLRPADWLFLGGLRSGVARFRFTNRFRVCCEVLSVVSGVRRRRAAGQKDSADRRRIPDTAT
jgi:CheR methyltransferase, SAM binding domain